MSVCLSTALYEKTYQHYIDNDKLRGWLKKLNYKFDEIIVMFNNITQEGYLKCVEYLNSIEGENIKFYFSEDQVEEVIKTFNLKPDYAISKEYYYSIANFSQLILSKSDYIMYICEDISLVNQCDEFISESIEVIDNIEDCLVTGMNWSSRGYGPDAPTLEENDVHLGFNNKETIKNNNFRLTNGFGDHVYFSSRKKLMSIDYNTFHHIPSSRFPHYSGESFDKRVNYYMFNNLLYRYTSKNYYYAHIGWIYYLKDILEDERTENFLPIP